MYYVSLHVHVLWSIDQELYKSLERMRPNMFRMASNLKPEDEGMEEILRTNDDLLRVTDSYKRVMGTGGQGGTPTQNGGMADDGGGAGRRSRVPEEAGAVGGGMMLAQGEGGGGGGTEGEGGGEVDASTLIDLADLDFGAIPTAGVGAMTPNMADSLLDTLGTLGKETCRTRFVCVRTVHIQYTFMCVMCVCTM